MIDLDEKYVDSSLPHRVIMGIRDHDSYVELNEWMVKNTKGLWTDEYDGLRYYMEFELQEDAVACKLRWT